MDKTKLLFNLSLVSFGASLIALIIAYRLFKPILYAALFFLLLGWALVLFANNFDKINAMLKRKRHQKQNQTKSNL